MSEDANDNTAAHRLVALIDSGRLSSEDVEIGHKCVRRLTQPLRLIVLGSDAAHAVGLMNLMSGDPIGTPRIDRVRIQCVQASKAFANVDYGDGASQSFGRERFGDLFDGSPARIKLGLSTPAMKRLSLMVAAETDTEKLCRAMEQTLLASDIAIFAGQELSPPMMSLWSEMPERLRDHSYLALAPGMPAESWSGIAAEFVDVLNIDTEAALAAKSQPGGVDKEAFREAGGVALVKAIKRELDVLAQSALDATEVLLSRYGDVPLDAPTITQKDARPEPVRNAPPPSKPRAESAAEPLREAKGAEPRVGQPETPNQPDSRARHQRPPSVKVPEPAPKLREDTPKEAARTVAPKKVRPKSDSERKRPGTPWSLDL